MTTHLDPKDAKAMIADMEARGDHTVPPFPDEATFGYIGHPAMFITQQALADAYLAAYVEHICRLRNWGHDETALAEATKIARSNFGYWAGYYDYETQVRVERLFGAVHPIFGSTKNGPVDPATAFNMGCAMGIAARGETE